MRFDRRDLFWTVFLGFFALDQGVKAWIQASLPVHGSFSGKPWPGVFELTLTYNKGIAFGMMQGAGQFMTPIALFISLMAGFYCLRHAREPWPVHIAMGLLASGAIGNLVDRVRFGQVTDMFWIRIIDFPVFNIADACITVAASLLILTWMTEGMRSGKKPAPPSASSGRPESSEPSAEPEPTPQPEASEDASVPASSPER